MTIHPNGPPSAPLTITWARLIAFGAVWFCAGLIIGAATAQFLLQ